MRHNQPLLPQPLLPLETFQPSFTYTVLASAVIGSAMAGVPLAHAQNTEPPAAPADVTTLPAISVQGDAPYQATEASSAKITAPLRDTPRTITVIPEQLIQDRGASSLADVLRTTPGITLGAGEGGTPTGDRPFIRGYESSTDISIDGVRDFARGYHETFNLEAVEITKGPSSAYGGRGGTGGAINMQTKTPKNINFAEVSAGFGNADQWSTTADGNVVLHDNIALRVNAMKMGGTTPGRDWVTIDRQGVAPSIIFGLDTATRATFSYSYVENKDMPDQGFPFSNDAHPELKRPNQHVDRRNFYGRRHVDFRDSWAKQATMLLEHDFDSGLHLRNITRQSETLNEYIMGRPTFSTTTVCAPGDLSAACDPNHPNAQFIKGWRARWRSTEALLNQTDLIGEFATGAFHHRFNLGAEFSRDEIRSRFMAPRGVNAQERDSLYAPDSGGRYNYTIEYRRKVLDGRIRTRSLYFFDTVEINPQWQVNAGVRYEHYKVFGHTYNNPNAAGAATTLTGTYTRGDHLLNWQTGLVYKPAHNGSIYLSYATSSNPAGENLGQGGGADGAAGAGQFNAATSQLKPEKSRSVELGTKWDVLDERLSLTAALFETRKTDARSVVNAATGEVSLDGNNRVRGLELGVTGAVTPRWDIWAGYTYLDAKNTKYASGSGAQYADYSGNRLKFIPKHSASLWTTYKVLPAVTVGGGVTYMGMRYADDRNHYQLPSYQRYDAMVKVEVNKNFTLQLNANNLTNTELYDASHVGLFYNVGPGRSYMLTATYRYN